MIEAQAASGGSPCLSMPATASRSPWEHHWASTSEEQRGTKAISTMDRVININRECVVNILNGYFPPFSPERIIAGERSS